MRRATGWIDCKQQLLMGTRRPSQELRSVSDAVSNMRSCHQGQHPSLTYIGIFQQHTKTSSRLCDVALATFV